MKKTSPFFKGFRDGIPIALGYFTVSFSLGIVMEGAGISAFAAGLMSFTNMTSAGQFAAVTSIEASVSLLVLALLQIVINGRYLLMSCALSQRLDRNCSMGKRLLLGMCVTDEIFGISIAVEEDYLDPLYSFGALCAACPGWTLGTVCGAVMGDVLPERVVAALGVALYGMLIAVFIPPTKKDKAVAVAVVSSMAVSFLWTKIPLLASISSGMKIIILTVVISLIAALVCPIKEEVTA